MISKTIVAGLLLLLPCLFLWPVVLGGEVLLPGNFLEHFEPWRSEVATPSTGQAEAHWNALQWDALAQYYPWRLFAHRNFRQGIIPLWNPHQFCGTPFLANGQSALFYPFNVLFYLMDPARAFGYLALLHLCLAGWFMYLFLRVLGTGRFGSLFGGLTFAFGGSIITWQELPTLVNVWVWLPLIWLLIEKYFRTGRLGYAGGAGAAVAVALLAGHPQVSFYLLLGSVVFYIFRACCREPGKLSARRSLIGAGILIGIAICLTAVQMLPIAEFVRYSHRTGEPGWAGYQTYLKFAMPWRHLVTLFLPDFFGNPSYGNYWDWKAGNYAEICCYAGILPLLLAGLGFSLRRNRYVWLFAVMAIFSLLIALGTPLNAIFFFGIPGFSRSGGPGRMLFLFTACIAVLGGMGTDAVVRHLRASEKSRSLVRLAALWVGGLILVAGLLVVVVWQGSERLRLMSFGELITESWQNVFVLLVTLLGGLAVLVAASRRRLSIELFQALVIGFLIFDLFLFGIDYNPTSPREKIYPVTPTIRYLQEYADSGRIMPLYQSWSLRKFPEAILPPNAATVYGLYDVQGYDSIYLASYRRVLEMVQGHDPSPAANGNMLLVNDFLDRSPALPMPIGAQSTLDGLAVSYVLSEGWLEKTNLKLFEGILGRPWHVYYRSSGPWPLRSWGMGGGLYTTIDDVSANSVTVGLVPSPIYVPRPLLGIILTDTFYPGWKAFVGGREFPVEPYSAFRMVRLPLNVRQFFGSKGFEKQVLFRYEPTSFRLGLFLFLVGLGILAGWGVGARGSRWTRRKQ